MTAIVLFRGGLLRPGHGAEFYRMRVLTMVGHAGCRL